MSYFIMTSQNTLQPFKMVLSIKLTIFVISYEMGEKAEYKCTYIVVVQLLSCVQLFVTPWTAARQASLSITISRNLLKLMSIESVMSSYHLILCHPLLLLPSIFPSIRVFPNESALHIRWPKYWSFSFIISPSDEYSGLISFRVDWYDLLLKRKMRKYKDTNE